MAHSRKTRNRKPAFGLEQFQLQGVYNALEGWTTKVSAFLNQVYSDLEDMQLNVQNDPDSPLAFLGAGKLLAAMQTTEHLESAIKGLQRPCPFELPSPVRVLQQYRGKSIEP